MRRATSGGRRLWLLPLIILWIAACSSAPVVNESGPRLIGTYTLEPTTPAPTRAISATPQPLPATNEVLSPLDEVTVEADFVLVTPTLPPSKTPTHTPTITATPTVSPTPTLVTATSTIVAFPTSMVQPVTAVVVQPDTRVCDSVWFFSQPAPASCPQFAPVVDQGVYQEFENGYMVWVGSQDAIYVMFNDAVNPHWQVFRDHFEEGMVSESPDFREAPRPETWQPRRGFGLLWRENRSLRERIGWATMEHEEPYSLQTQVAQDGTLFIEEPGEGVFALMPNGSGWQRYAGMGG